MKKLFLLPAIITSFFLCGCTAQEQPKAITEQEPPKAVNEQVIYQGLENVFDKYDAGNMNEFQSEKNKFGEKEFIVDFNERRKGYDHKYGYTIDYAANVQVFDPRRISGNETYEFAELIFVDKKYFDENSGLNADTDLIGKRVRIKLYAYETGRPLSKEAGDTSFYATRNPAEDRVWSVGRTYIFYYELLEVLGDAE